MFSDFSFELPLLSSILKYPCPIIDATDCTRVAASIGDDEDARSAQCPCSNRIGDVTAELVALRKVNARDGGE